MVSYWLSDFTSKKVIKSIERLCYSFLWNGVPDSAKGAKVKWSTVCQPKLKVV